ncbi:MAG: hypothetical protein CVT88_08885 [Candidatus Altiarchaeales archaeon HGW-Altiarchaeales-1]|nr:MAG: hypothetical protein CVT88_08885 [Candidatus Altiarchaeales archaeon HGW-Altiarchaeales-1]PKP58403.1 MAG: hypothetical protein CVT89_02920 [Candidatus Altiarchaeales archaeon HGW-Altiarchaeales-2]
MSNNILIHLPKKMASRAEFFIELEEYKNREEFYKDAIRRFIEFKEQTTDVWLMEFESLVGEIPKSRKTEKELANQMKKVRDELWRKKYAKKYEHATGIGQ